MAMDRLPALRNSLTVKRRAGESCAYSTLETHVSRGGRRTCCVAQQFDCVVPGRASKYCVAQASLKGRLPYSPSCARA